MELSKELPIFNIIDKHLDLINNDTMVLEINFTKDKGTFTEMDFNNFTNVLRSLGFEEKIHNECLEVISDQDMMIINGMPKILAHCMSNSFDDKTIWKKKKLTSSDNINDLFDLDIQMKTYNITPSVHPENWDDMRKQFIIKQYIEYTNKNTSVKYIANLYKTAEDEYYTLKQSSILKDKQNYGFSIIFEDNKYNQNIILQSIITGIQAITMSSMLLTKSQQKNILNEYYSLIKNDIEISFYNKMSNDPPLLAPKPITLENPKANVLAQRAQKSGIKGIELAQFLAQMEHESWDFRKMKEVPQGKDYFKRYDPKHAPRTAQKLGNVKAGDGERFRGRGFIQLTGRDNYRAASQALGVDLIKNPDLAARPDIAAEIAIWYWFERVRPGVMDFANTVAVTKRINPALAGIEDRHENFKYYLKYMR